MPAQSSRISLPDLKHLLTAGGLVAGTLGTLLLGAALQVEPHAAEPAEAPASAAALPPAGGTLAAVEVESAAPAQPAPTPEANAPVPARTPDARPTASAPASSTPEPRAAPDRREDAARLLAAGGGFTLQFMVTCNAQTADGLRRQLDGDPQLFVLPVDLEGRTCRRICWGSFSTRERALQSKDWPQALAAINAEPLARAVGDVLP